MDQLDQTLEFKYEPSWRFVSFFSIIFLPISIWLIYLPFQNPCSLDRKHGDCSFNSPQTELAFKFFMLLLGGMCIFFVLFVIGKKLKFKPKLTIKDGQIFVPAYSYSGTTNSLRISEITSVEIYINNLNISCTLRTDTDSQAIAVNNLDQNDFESIYVFLQLNATNANFTVADLNKNYEYLRIRELLNSNPSVMLTLIYSIPILIGAGEIHSYYDNQLSGTIILPLSVFASVLYLMPVLYLSKQLKMKQLKPLKKSFCYFFIFLSFIFSFQLSLDLISLVNQKFDTSAEVQSVAELSKDVNQLPDDKNKNGECYFLKSRESASEDFGDGKICRNNFHELDSKKKVIYYYKLGVIGEKWMTKHELEKNN